MTMCPATFHGTWHALRVHGCTCPEAAADRRRTQREYEKKSYLNRGPLRVPVLGTLRRKQALAAMGWSEEALSDAMGRTAPKVRPGRGPNVDRDTDLWWRQAFERFGMVEGPSTRARAMARTRGWAPALAWLDIDDPNDEPAIAPSVLREAEQRRGSQVKRRRKARLRRLEEAGYSIEGWRNNPQRTVPTVTQYRRNLLVKSQSAARKRVAA